MTNIRIDLGRVLECVCGVVVVERLDGTRVEHATGRVHLHVLTGAA